MKDLIESVRFLVSGEFRKSGKRARPGTHEYAVLVPGSFWEKHARDNMKRVIAIKHSDIINPGYNAMYRTAVVFIRRHPILGHPISRTPPERRSLISRGGPNRPTLRASVRASGERRQPCKCACSTPCCWCCVASQRQRGIASNGRVPSLARRLDGKTFALPARCAPRVMR